MLEGTPGCTGGVVLGDCKWLWCVFSYAQDGMFAANVHTYFCCVDQNPRKDESRATIITNAFLHYYSRFPFDFMEITCKNAFLSRPLESVRVSDGVGIMPEEAAYVFVGVPKFHASQRFIPAYDLSDTEPEYLVPDIKVVDELGQRMCRNWPEKTYNSDELVERLQHEADQPDSGPSPCTADMATEWRRTLALSGSSVPILTATAGGLWTRMGMPF